MVGYDCSSDMIRIAKQKLVENFRRMDCEFNLANDSKTNSEEKNFFKTFGFSYYILYEGESSSAGSSSSTGAGVVGSSTQYAASSQNSSYYYTIKIFHVFFP